MYSVLQPPIVFLLINLAISTKCNTGSQECAGDVLRICTEDGYWSEMPCPESAKCTVDAGVAMCKVKGKGLAEDEEVVPKKVKVVTVTKKLPKISETSSTEEREIEKKIKTQKHQLPTKIQLEISKIDPKIGTKVPISAIFSTDSVSDTKPYEISASLKEIKSNPEMKNDASFTPNSNNSLNNSDSTDVKATLSNQIGDSNKLFSNTVSYKSDTTYGTNDLAKSPSSSNNQVSSDLSKSETSTKLVQNAANSPSNNMPNYSSTDQSNSPNDKKDQASKKPSSSQSSTGSPSQIAGDKNSINNTGGNIVSADQLTKALKEVGYTPNPEYLNAVIKGVNSNFKDRELAAMFLAQISHETGGIVHIEEIECKNNKCLGRYDTGGLPGKSYHGRGFIQLTWPDNYKKASAALGMGEKLYQDPDMVLKDLDIAFKVSLWYWDSVVMKEPGVSEKKQFGLTTKAINGKLECNGGNPAQVEKRYKFYQAIAKSMGITNLAQNTGC